MTSFFRSRGGTSLLGLSLDGDRLEAVSVRRTNGSVEIRRSTTVTLSLDPLTNEPELVGREIRKHLDAAGIRERRCAVCLPTAWALTLQVQLPDLPPADLESFLELETERGLPYGPENLILAQSRFTTAGGESFASLLGVPREHVRRLQNALAAAQLDPVTLGLGMTALRPRPVDSGEAVMLLAPGPGTLGLLVTLGDAVASLRMFDSAYESVGGAPQLQVDSLLRELRISLGQLPAAVRSAVRRLVVLGSGEASTELFEELQGPAGSWNLRLERVREYAEGAMPLGVPSGTAISPALSLAVLHLAGAGTGFEFLPPRITAWERLTARYSSGRLLWSGIAAGAVAGLVALAFGIQQIRLNHWQKEFDRIAPQVTQLEEIQQDIRDHRPWFDESYRTMNVLRLLTEAFPEDGAVWAKSVEFRDADVVICAGTARDQKALLATFERLRGTLGFENVRIEQSVGEAPVEFTLNFHWAGLHGL